MGPPGFDGEGVLIKTTRARLCPQKRRLLITGKTTQVAKVVALGAMTFNDAISMVSNDTVLLAA